MSERGIATQVIVAVIVIVVVAAGAGVYLFTAGPPGPGGDQTGGGAGGGQENNQAGGGAEETGIPAYTEATVFSIPSDMKSSLGIPASATCQGYSTSAGATTVADWYKGQMSGWTLESENSFPVQSGTLYMLFYSKGDNRAFIFSENNPMGSGTLFGVVTGSWSLI